MEHAPLDRVIINLRILGKVPPNARVRTNGVFIEHDQDTLQGYKRWRDREGRVNNRRALRELTDEAVRFSEAHKADRIALIQLNDAMNTGKRGLTTLIETTYGNDATTRAILNRQTERLNQQIARNNDYINMLPHHPPSTPAIHIPTTTTPPHHPRNSYTNTPSTPSSHMSITPSPSPSPNPMPSSPPSTSPSAAASSSSSSHDEEDDNSEEEDAANEANLALSL